MSIAWKEEFHRHRRTIKTQILTKNQWKIWEVEDFVLSLSHAHSKLAATMVLTIGLPRSDSVSSDLFITFCYLIFHQPPKKLVDCYNIMSNQSIEKTTFPRLIAHDAILTHWFWRLAFEHLQWPIESCFEWETLFILLMIWWLYT